MNRTQRPEPAHQRGQAAGVIELLARAVRLDYGSQAAVAGGDPKMRTQFDAGQVDIARKDSRYLLLFLALKVRKDQ